MENELITDTEYLRFGGGHLFVNQYEHFIIFNDYTIEGNMLYDSFLGMNVNKINVEFTKNSRYTKRPTFGGHYLSNNQFERNIEGLVQDLTEVYDIHPHYHSSDLTLRARDLIGYNKPLDSLSKINIDANAQFQFYRGMIANKGSTNSITAYTNSKRFTEASIDEYWAYKVSEFGDMRKKIYPEIKLTNIDNDTNDTRLMFIDIFGADTTNKNRMIKEGTNSGFDIITENSIERWNNYYDQMDHIKNNILFIGVEVNEIARIFIADYQPPTMKLMDIDYWLDSKNLVLKQYTGSNWIEVPRHNWRIYNYKKETRLAWKHNNICEDVRIVADIYRYNVINIPYSVVDGTKCTIPGNYADILAPGNQLLFTPSYTSVKTVRYNHYTKRTEVELNDDIGTYQGMIDANVLNTKRTYGAIIDDISTLGRLNSETVLLPVGKSPAIYTVFSMNPAKDRNNTIKLIDSESNTVLEDIQLWHPALGYHNHLVIQNVDIFKGIDPASYTDTYDPLNNPKKFWNDAEEDKIWVDTSYLAYKPYYDWSLYRTSDEQLVDWGKMTDFGDAKVYKWTKSPVPPDRWNNLVSLQAKDKSVLLQNKLSGAVKTEFFLNTRALYNARFNFVDHTITIEDEVNGLVEFDTIVFGTGYYIPDNLTQDSTAHVVDLDGNKFRLADYQDNYIEFETITAQANITPIIVPDDDDNRVIEYAITVPKATFKINDVIQFSSSNGILPSEISSEDVYSIEDIIISNIGYDIIKLSGLTSITPPNYDVIPTSPSTKYRIWCNTENKWVEGWNRYYPVRCFNDIGHDIDVSQTTIVEDVNVTMGIINATLISRPTVLTHGFRTSEWTKRPFIRYRTPLRVLTSIDKAGINTPILTWTNVSDIVWYDNEKVDIYANGTLKESSVPIKVLGNEITINATGLYYAYEILDIVRSYADLDLTFDPIIADDGLQTSWWKQEYEYSTVNTSDEQDNLITYYYFWVEQCTNLSTRYPNKLPVMQVRNYLLNNSDPYYVPLYLKETGNIDLLNNTEGNMLYKGAVKTPTDIVLGKTPLAYRQLVIKNISHYITESDRYMLRFTENLQLRNDIKSNHLNTNLKNMHTEWLLFRQFQNNNVDIRLWNKMVDALCGDQVSRSRLLYDKLYGTTTRYGLGTDQIFVESSIGLATVLSYLTDPSVDFSPIEINLFFETHQFDTPENIRIAMMDIYNTFGYIHVNTIWFNILHDALALKGNIPELMKTSWISLHGVQAIDINGMFDD